MLYPNKFFTVCNHTPDPACLLVYPTAHKFRTRPSHFSLRAGTDGFEVAVDTVQVADPHPTSIASAKAHSQQPHARPPAGPRPRETAHGGDPDWRVRNRLPGDSGAPVVSSCCSRPQSLADSRPACDAPPPTAAAPHERRARTQVFPEKKDGGYATVCRKDVPGCDGALLCVGSRNVFVPRGATLHLWPA